MKNEIDPTSIDEIEDFDLQAPDYQVWLIGYDETGEILDWDEKVFNSSDPDAAVEFAKEFVVQDKIQNRSIPDQVKFVRIEVEEVVQVEGDENNIGSIFYDTITL